MDNDAEIGVGEITILNYAVDGYYVKLGRVMVNVEQSIATRRQTDATYKMTRVDLTPIAKAEGFRLEH